LYVHAATSFSTASRVDVSTCSTMLRCCTALLLLLLVEYIQVVAERPCIHSCPHMEH
jgi:hypothetical protein